MRLVFVIGEEADGAGGTRGMHALTRRGTAGESSRRRSIRRSTRRCFRRCRYRVGCSCSGTQRRRFARARPRPRPLL